MSAVLRSHKCPGLDDKLGGYVPYKPTSDSVVVILLTFRGEKYWEASACFFSCSRYPEMKICIKMAK